MKFGSSSDSILCRELSLVSKGLPSPYSILLFLLGTSAIEKFTDFSFN
jgi:hypothetical protein